MTCAHVAEAKAFAEQIIFGALKFQVPSNSTTPNTQIIPKTLPMGVGGTSQLTPSWTMNPYDCRAKVFCTPVLGTTPNTLNPDTLPKGLASGQQTAGSEFVVDLSGFSAGLISANASYIPGVRGAQSVEANISAIDPLNRLIYVQCYNTTTGAAAPATTGAVIAVQFEFSDSYAM